MKPVPKGGGMVGGEVPLDKFSLDNLVFLAVCILVYLASPTSKIFATLETMSHSLTTMFGSGPGYNKLQVCSLKINVRN